MMEDSTATNYSSVWEEPSTSKTFSSPSFMKEVLTRRSTIASVAQKTTTTTTTSNDYTSMLESECMDVSQGGDFSPSVVAARSDVSPKQNYEVPQPLQENQSKEEEAAAAASAVSKSLNSMPGSDIFEALSRDFPVDFIRKDATLNIIKKSKYLIPGAIGAFLLLVVTAPVLLLTNGDAAMSYATVAFVGNSMQYYNDLPRFMEVLSDDHITQDSVLHGDATIVNLLQTGNGMYYKFNSTNAEIPGTDFMDFGACSVHQLLFGYDRYLYNQWLYMNISLVTDDYTGFIDDGRNPCLEDEDYLDYKMAQLSLEEPKWDFIFINDHTLSPARTSSRTESLATLNSTYISWFERLGATPVFLCTYAYWTQWRDMRGLEDVPTFTSLTYEGYRQYAELLSDNLPSNQKARVAPIGLAFLLVWEENRNMWYKLFHYDEVHPSPYGTFLEGLVIHHTLFGRLPSKSRVVISSMSSLFSRARRMQPPTHPRKPFPTRDEASYLYNVAERISRGKIPKSFIKYTNGEGAADYEYDSSYTGYQPDG